jgi:chemotaxis-related protein WspB
MLFLLFELGEDRYALDAGQIVEVLPLVDIKRIPQAPTGVAGVFDCRGVPVPVIDLSQLVLGRPARRCLSTRLIIARYPDDRGGMRTVGLIAEKATKTVRRDLADFVDSGVSSNGAARGPVAFDRLGLVQRIDICTLLPAPVREALFSPAVEHRWTSPTSKAS